jgi:CotH kinase protein
MQIVTLQRSVSHQFADGCGRRVAVLAVLASLSACSSETSEPGGGASSSSGGWLTTPSAGLESSTEGMSDPSGPTASSVSAGESSSGPTLDLGGGESTGGTRNDSWFVPTREPLRLALFLDEAARAALEADPGTYVRAGFEVDDPEIGTELLEVGVKLKGVGSFRDLAGKAAFKIDFDRYVDGQYVLGTEKIVLNSQVQDPSGIHEWLSYELFRAVGVPAPRVGFATLEVDGEAYGLYLIVETYDEPWLDGAFASTQHLYKGEDGGDAIPENVDILDVDHGSALERSDLAALAAAVQVAPSPGFMDATAAFLDWNEVLHEIAVELFVGHWDGYAPVRNNYYLHDGDDGVFRILPWGTDQTFVTSMDPFFGLEPTIRGVLWQGCLADDECRAAYRLALTDVLAAADALAPDDQARAMATMIRPHQDADPRRESPPEGAEPTLVFWHAQLATFPELIACDAGNCP